METRIVTEYTFRRLKREVKVFGSVLLRVYDRGNVVYVSVQEQKGELMDVTNKMRIHC